MNLRKYWQTSYLESGHKQLSRDVSPFRYPGGKGNLKYMLASIINHNGLRNCTMIEPFCGGAGATLPLLLAGVIGKLRLGDFDKRVAEFWDSLLGDPEGLIRLIQETPTTIDEWHRMRRWAGFERNMDGQSALKCGFATLFLNRVNYSGLLHARPIGGLDQSGKYKMDCRFNKSDIISRIQNIRSCVRHILKAARRSSHAYWRSTLNSAWMADGTGNTLAFIDPPYVGKGPVLYKRYGFANGHEELAEYLKSNDRMQWVLTYDNDPLIFELYKDFKIIELDSQFMMQESKMGRELVITSHNLNVPMPEGDA